MLGKEQRDKFKILILISLTRDDQNVAFKVWKSAGKTYHPYYHRYFWAKRVHEEQWCLPVFSCEFCGDHCNPVLKDVVYSCLLSLYIACTIRDRRNRYTVHFQQNCACQLFLIQSYCDLSCHLHVINQHSRIPLIPYLTGLFGFWIFIQ